MDEFEFENEDDDEEQPAPEPSRSGSWFVWLSLPLLFVLGLGSGWLIWGRAPAAQAQTSADVQIPAQVTRYDVSTDDDPSLGPADAPITIIEFSDYQCPFCIRWYQTVSSRLLKDYQGKIRFVYRDLPLSAIHPEAQAAAEAADCAGEQSAYWQYHDALFSEKYGLGVDAYDRYATDLSLNTQAFNLCLAQHRYKSEVDADASYATDLGVNSTPAFFINGLYVMGAQPYEVFQQIIDKELAGQIP